MRGNTQVLQIHYRTKMGYAQYVSGKGVYAAYLRIKNEQFSFDTFSNKIDQFRVKHYL